MISDLIDCNFELDIAISNINGKLEFYLKFYWITLLTDIIDALIVLEPYFNFLDTQIINTQDFYDRMVNLFVKQDFLENRMIWALSLLSQLGYQNVKDLLPVKYSQKLLNHQNELIRIRSASIFQELKALEKMVETCQPNHKFEVMLKIAEIKAKRPANLELKKIKFNDKSVNDFLIDEIGKKKHDFQTKLLALQYSVC